MLVKAEGGEVLDANVTTGNAQAGGKVGETFELVD